MPYRHHVFKGTPGLILVSMLLGNANRHFPRHAAWVRTRPMDPQKCDLEDAVLHFVDRDVAPIPRLVVYSADMDRRLGARRHLIKIFDCGAPAVFGCLEDNVNAIAV